MDVGSARQEELDTVLQVMCAAFELPYEAARPIYYADPYFDAENKRVLRVNGKIVSCLTLTSARCQAGKAVLPIAGVTGVATLPQHQRRGYGGQLITSALQTIRERGYALAGLFPYDYAYYRRLGWETASVGCKYLAAPSVLPNDAGTTTAHPAGVAHWEAMASVYQACAENQALWAIRDAKRWNYVLERVANKFVYLDSAETVEGYLLYDIQPGIVQLGAAQKEQPPILRVLELCAVTARARRGLIAHLAAQRQVGLIEYATTPRHLEALELLPGVCPPHCDEPFARMELVPTLMLRVVNFTRLLEELRANWEGFQGEIILALRDDVFAEASESVLITGNGSGLPRVTTASDLQIVDDAIEQAQANLPLPAPRCRVEADVRVWSQVAVGYISGEEACARGLLKPSAPDAAHLAGLLFPARAPFLPAPDHF